MNITSLIANCFGNKLVNVVLNPPPAGISSARFSFMNPYPLEIFSVEGGRVEETRPPIFKPDLFAEWLFNLRENVRGSFPGKWSERFGQFPMDFVHCECKKKTKKTKGLRGKKGKTMKIDHKKSTRKCAFKKCSFLQGFSVRKELTMDKCRGVNQKVPSKLGIKIHSILPQLRWAKSCDSSRRIASESYRRDSNHYISLAVISPTLRSDSSRAIGVHSCNIRCTWNCGMACESWLRSLNASNWRLTILPS